MRAFFLALALLFVTGCGEPKEIAECRTLKAEGLACVEYKPLEEALAKHRAKQSQTELRARYARGEKLCKLHARLTWSREKRNKLAHCYNILSAYDREQREKN